MLCRALCAVAAVSYVLCLLVLSGVQKDDLDAATLRKLQRHNVNIADNDGKLREQCLEKNKAATSSSTTEQVELKIENDRSSSQPAAIVLNTAAELKKILNYFKEKETQREINIKEQTTQSNFILNGTLVDLSKLPSAVQSRVLKEIVDSRTETIINRGVNRDSERLTLAHDDNDLQNIEKVQQERSSDKLNKKITENPNDVEYISKIVAQVLAQRQTTTSPPPTTNFYRSKLAQEIESMLAKGLMKTFPQNFYLNNLNLTDALNPSPVEHKKNEEKDVIVALLNQLKNRNGLSNPYLTGMKKITNLDDDQDVNRFETKPKEGRGGNRILLNNRNDNKPVTVDSNRNVHTVNGQFLSKWQNVNVDQNKKSSKAGLAGTNLRCIIFSHPNDPCKTQNNNEFNPNEANWSIWSFIIDGLSKGELKIQDVQKISSMYWPTDHKLKPDIKNDLSIDNRYKNDWLFHRRSGEQFQFKEKYRQNSANEPSFRGNFHKNTWSNDYEEPRMKQEYAFDRNKLSQVPNEKTEYNNKLASNDEDFPLMNQPKNQANLSESVRPILNTNKDTDFGKTYKSNKLSVTGKEDIEKPKSIPPGMIKEIADSVKELVLRDLKKELSTSAAIISTTEPTTTESTTTPGTSTTSTTTPAAAQTTTTTTTIVEPTTTKTQTITTTTEKLSTTVRDDHLNIQEASKALEKFMEVFEKFKSIKDSIIVPENITHKDNTNNNHVVIKEVNRELRLSYPRPYGPYDIRSQMKRPMPQILDPYTDPTTPEPVKSRSSKKPHGYALTLQTNSDEIHPLNVAVSRPLSLYNTIVVTPLPARQRSRNLHQGTYSAEPGYRKPERYQIERMESKSGLSPSKGSYRDNSNLKYVSRAKTRGKKERNYKGRGYKSRGLHGVEKFHEKLERTDNWQRYGPEEKCSGSKENCNEQVAPRKQRPLINTGNSYDDTHFRNFLKTQQKVTDMLEKILATNTKHIPRSAEVI